MEPPATRLTIEDLAHGEAEWQELCRSYRELAHVAWEHVAELTTRLNRVNAAYYRLREDYRQLRAHGAR